MRDLIRMVEAEEPVQLAGARNSKYNSSPSLFSKADLFTEAQLFAVYMLDTGEEYVNKKEFRRALKDCGAVKACYDSDKQLYQRTVVEGKREYLWALRNQQRWRNATLVAARKELGLKD